MAGKSGTTNDYRDAWMMAYSPNIAIGAWVGHTGPGNANMNGVYGTMVGSSLLRDFINNGLQQAGIPQSISSSRAACLGTAVRGQFEHRRVALAQPLGQPLCDSELICDQVFGKGTLPAGHRMQAGAIALREPVIDADDRPEHSTQHLRIADSNADPDAERQRERRRARPGRPV